MADNSIYMKHRMKKDLLQGLRSYPAPVYRAPDELSRGRQGKFYQSIDQVIPADRLRRPLAAGLEPRAVTMNKRAKAWKSLRKGKNI
jgi:hypothetical protein